MRSGFHSDYLESRTACSDGHSAHLIADSRRAALKRLGLLTSGCIGLSIANIASHLSLSTQPTSQSVFDSHEILNLWIEIPKPSFSLLERDPRSYVPGRLRLDQGNFFSCRIKLKGHGTFRSISEKPSLTIKPDPHSPNSVAPISTKLHLNNSIDDESLLHEWIASKVFRSALVPYPLVTHSFVKLNGRSIGMYVLREGFDNPFLLRHFTQPLGSVYEPDSTPSHGLLTNQWNVVQGKSTSTAIPNPLRYQLIDNHQFNNRQEHEAKLIAELFDASQFVRLGVIENLLGHWDGFWSSGNNFRLYLPESGKAQLLPTGADQILALPDAPLVSKPRDQVAQEIMRHPTHQNLFLKFAYSLADASIVYDSWATDGKTRCDQIIEKVGWKNRSAYRQVVEALFRRAKARVESLPKLVKNLEEQLT